MSTVRPDARGERGLGFYSESIRKRGSGPQELSLEALADLFENAPIGVYAVQNRRFVFVNHRLLLDTGYEAHELLGSDPLEIVSPDHRALVRESATRMLKGERLPPYEYDVVAKGRRVRRVLESVESLTLDGERASLGYFMDITERKWQRDALRETTDRYQIVVESITDAISINVGDRRVFVNDAFRALVGAHDSGLSMPIPVGDFVLEEDRELLVGRTLARQRGEPVPATYEYRIRRANGEVRQIETSSTAITYEGEPAALAVIRDVTDQRRLERELREQAEELSRSNRDLEQFAFIASHDLQEPLRMISSYLQLLARRYQGKLDQTADEFIGYAVDGAHRMQGLINDILAYSRVATQAKVLGPVDTQALVDTVVRDLTGAIADTGASVHYEGLPTVIGDEGQLAQVFRNLVSNAIKFCADRHPRITVACSREGQDWRFAVTDNGPGIDPQFSERIFGLFQRLHTRSEYPGSGIGLAICRKIIERHGGRIWVESDPGAGSTFWISIPSQLNGGG